MTSFFPLQTDQLFVFEKKKIESWMTWDMLIFGEGK